MAWPLGLTVQAHPRKVGGVAGLGLTIEKGATLRLKDRVVLVTGAGGTIGNAVSRLVAAHGAQVALTDMAAEPLEAIISELRAAVLPCGAGHAMPLTSSTFRPW